MAEPSSLQSDDPRAMSLADLLAAIALREDDRVGFDIALSEFHYRWEGRILGIALMGRFAFPGNHFGFDDFALEIWVRLIEKMPMFDPAGKSGDALENRFLGWLMKLIANLHTDIVRGFGQPLSELTEDIDVATEIEGKGRIDLFRAPAPGSPEALREHELFEGLRPAVIDAIHCLRGLRAERQEVLRRSSPFFKAAGTGVEIPIDLLDAIVDELKTTRDGFKATRSRALKQVHECMDRKNAARRVQGGL